MVEVKNIEINKRLNQCLKQVDFAIVLAEVMLVLTILGSIASFTVPLLIDKVQEKIRISAWKSAYSDINQATNRIMMENGGTMKGFYQGAAYTTRYTNMREAYLKYLNYTKKCDCYSAYGKGCWSMSMINSTVVDSEVWTGALLSNGMQILFSADSPNADCSSLWGGTHRFCGYILVDINGSKKPNELGKDVFDAFILENGLTPVGSIRMGCDEGCCDPSNPNEGCSAYYLYH